MTEVQKEYRNTLRFIRYYRIAVKNCEAQKRWKAKQQNLEWLHFFLGMGQGLRSMYSLFSKEAYHGTH